MSGNNKDPLDFLTPNGIMIFMIVGLLLCSVLSVFFITKSVSSYPHYSGGKVTKQSPEELKKYYQDRYKERLAVYKVTYDGIMQNAVEYSCDTDVKCFKTSFCDVRQSGTQSVVYDLVNKQKLATFNKDSFSIEKVGMQIATFCTGEKNVK